LKITFPILVAEDDLTTRKLLEKILAKNGFEVTAVNNGRQALEAFEKAFFPIVLTDWVMPEMTGLELCEAVRQRVSDKYVFIVLLTGRDCSDDVVRGLDAGADDYLTKPFNPAELLARLKAGTRILQYESSLKQAHEEIRILSITDPLTGCYNRKYMVENLVFEIEKAARNGSSLSLALSDIDRFKKVNDSFGHQIGDAVLKKFHHCLRSSICDGVDWIARYGGDEFIVVFPETDLEAATGRAEKARSLLCREVIEVEGVAIPTTVSFGVISVEPRRHLSISPDHIVSEADRCLYQAKNEGRNTVRACRFDTMLFGPSGERVDRSEKIVDTIVGREPKAICNP
jgi:diguanylate cyclase (GGDEF)-like protein